MTPSEYEPDCIRLRGSLLQGITANGCKIASKVIQDENPVLPLKKR
jgi:hypothetical protein